MKLSSNAVSSYPVDKSENDYGKFWKKNLNKNITADNYFVINDNAEPECNELIKMNVIVLWKILLQMKSISIQLATV